MPEIYENAIVEKRNVLNELRSNNMTVQELRLFSIYLSKINPWDKTTRVVRFPIEDFQRIMGIGRINMQHIRTRIDSMLMKVVHVPNERGGFTAFQLFKRCKVDCNQDGEWYIELDASDDALPLMFDFKNRYFKYELWNALRLKSANQLRMYEILKQYEKIGRREIAVDDLRELLGLSPDEYSNRFNNFKTRVLDSCQQALKEFTDICYTYEKGRSGAGGKWLTIIFHIFKNEQHADPLTMKAFLDAQPEPIQDLSENKFFITERIDDESVEEFEEYGSETLANLAEVCNNEFGREEMKLIFRVLTRIDIPKDPLTDSLEWGRVFYLEEKYSAMNVENARKKRSGEEPIKNRFKYFLKMLEADTSRPASYSD